MEARAVHQVNNSQIVVKEKLKTTSVNSATKVLIVDLNSRYTNKCTLAIDRTNAQCAPKHLHRQMISNDTKWCTLALKRTSAQHASNHLVKRVISNNTSLFTIAELFLNSYVMSATTSITSFRLRAPLIFSIRLFIVTPFLPLRLLNRYKYQISVLIALTTNARRRMNWGGRLFIA